MYPFSGTRAERVLFLYFAVCILGCVFRGANSGVCILRCIQRSRTTLASDLQDLQRILGHRAAPIRTVGIFSPERLFANILRIRTLPKAHFRPIFCKMLAMFVLLQFAPTKMADFVGNKSDGTENANNAVFHRLQQNENGVSAARMLAFKRDFRILPTLPNS